MKIRMLTSIAGPEFVLNIGDVTDFPEEQAKRLIHKGFAEPTRAAKKFPPKKQNKTETAEHYMAEIETATEE